MAPSDSNPWYTTREKVKAALDVKYTAFADTRVDDACGTGSRAVDNLCSRKFFPWTGTRKLDWPEMPYSGSVPWRKWLNENELASLTTLTSGGTVIPSSGYLLEPVNAGPPYTRIDINLGSSSSFSAGSTWQQSMLLTGVFCGCPLTTTPGGTLAAAITTTSATTCLLSDSASVGVGSILLIDSERLMVTNKTMVTTALTLQADLTASAANNTVQTTNGAAFTVGETLLLDAERMLINDISGNNLTVKRAWDGTTLATHTGAVVIYAPRTATVTRGALGTTAATHLISAPITVHAVPDPIATLAKAEALCVLLGEEAGWARMVGSADNARPAAGGGINDMRKQVVSGYARRRIRAI